MGTNASAVPNLTIGLDVSDRWVALCAVDAAGEVVERGRLRTTQGALGSRFGSMQPTRVVLEVGQHSPWMCRLLKECGHEVIVANPRQLRLIYQSEDKSDPTDAESLARLARMDRRLLKPIRHRSAAVQAHLGILRARQNLVASRTQLVNHARGACKAFGVRLPKCSTASFGRKAARTLPEELAGALTPILEMATELTRQIRTYDKQIEGLCEEHYPETMLLRQVPGVGSITALAFVLTLEDPGRFSSSRAVGAYFGLRPRRSQSGAHEPELRITKAGDKMLRTLLVQAAHYILGPFAPDTDLRHWGQKLAARGGKTAKKKAAVAVARKLAVLLHRLWVTAEEYEPLRQTRRRAQAA